MRSLSTPKTLQRWIGRNSFYLKGIALAGLLLLPAGVGFYATRALLTQPESTNCNQRFTAESSVPERLYCAETLAQQRTANGFQRAIALARGVPVSHPLRPQSESLIESWSERLLELAEETFQRGNLAEAIAMIDAIPPTSSLSDFSKDRQTAWQDTWEEASRIYEDAQAAIDREDWGIALQEGRQLWQVDNRYWARDRYQMLMSELQAKREQLEAEERLAKERQERRARNSPRTVDDVVANWERERDAEATQYLQQARQAADVGDFQGAIDEARRVLWGTPQYEEAQALILQLRSEIDYAEDQAYLQEARAIASAGDLRSLRDAISTARRIPSYRQSYPEAQAEIDRWTAEIRRLSEATFPVSDQSADLPPRWNRSIFTEEPEPELGEPAGSGAIE